MLFFIVGFCRPLSDLSEKIMIEISTRKFCGTGQENGSAKMSDANLDSDKPRKKFACLKSKKKECKLNRSQGDANNVKEKARTKGKSLPWSFSYKFTLQYYIFSKKCHYKI